MSVARGLRRRLLSPTALGLALVACGPAPADRGAEAEATVATPTPARGGLALDDLERVVATLHEKFSALAAAMPEDHLDWRPMEGVRSVEEVFVHVAADNYYVPALLGWAAPAETGVTSDVETFRSFQERAMTRDEMIEAVDASFIFFLDAMRESRGELDRDVVLGSPTTVGDVWIRAVVHLHEHLGQSIAYGRSNEIVPPWSRTDGDGP